MSKYRRPHANFRSYDNLFFGYPDSSNIGPSSYRPVLPNIFRDKDKFWYNTEGEEHRSDGPSDYILDTIIWRYDGDIVTKEVTEWCNRKEADPFDLSEVEIMIMWSEILS